MYLTFLDVLFVFHRKQLLHTVYGEIFLTVLYMPETVIGSSELPYYVVWKEYGSYSELVCVWFWTCFLNFSQENECSFHNEIFFPVVYMPETIIGYFKLTYAV